MHEVATPVAAPRDNLFGICHALGETFGIDAIYLRVVLMVGMLVNFQWALIAYAVGGVAVLTARLLTGGVRFGIRPPVKAG